jgi:hypothetical protein
MKPLSLTIIYTSRGAEMITSMLRLMDNSHHMNSPDKEIPVLSVSRADLQQVGFNINKVSDVTLKKLAANMASIYRSVFGEFSTRLEHAAQKLKIPRIRKTPQEKVAEELQCCLVDAHIDEIVSRKREIYNLGAFEGPGQIISKTSKGKLDSWIDPKTQKVRHKWWYA